MSFEVFIVVVSNHSPESVDSPKPRWYFVTFAKDFLDDRPYKFTVYGEVFILFRDIERKLTCYLLPSSTQIQHTDNIFLRPFLAVEKQGIIWFWHGNSELADENLITAIDSSSQPVNYSEQDLHDHDEN